MTWGRLDDKTATSPAFVSIADAALRRAAKRMPEQPMNDVLEAARIDTFRARALHLFAVMFTVPAMTDGKITPAVAEQICSAASMSMIEFTEAAELLVTSKAWRLNKRSKAEPLGSWQMLLGWKPGEQPLRADEEMKQARATLRGRLREGREDYPNRVAAVERAAGHCEYCDCRIGPEGGQMDHVDPSLMSNELGNLAHVCARCNKRKGNHPLDAVGMSFTPRARRARGLGEQA
jgi:hypothetical protein